MSPIAVAALVLLTVLCLANLAVTVALVKRIREIDQTVADLAADPLEPLLPPGVAVDEFSATTVDGATVTQDVLTAGTIVGFLNPTCETCHGHIPDFTATARALPEGAAAIAVVRHHDDPETLAEMVKPLAEACTVVVEDRRGPIWRAFNTQATPAFCRMGADRVIAAHGYRDKS